MSRQGKFYRSFVIILLILLMAGCSFVTPTPTPVPSPTYTPTFTPTPTITPTPTPTSTPTPTPTPTPVPPQALFPQAAQLCDEAFQQPIQAGSPAPGVLALIFKYEEKQWEIETLPHGPESAPEVKTLVCIKEDVERATTYTPGNIPGYRLIWHARLVNWPDGNVLAKKTISGDDPPEIFLYTGQPPSAVYGEPPLTYLLEWLASFRIWQDVAIVPDHITIAFSPNGQTLASLSKSGEVRFWRVPDCTLSRSREILLADTRIAAFSPDLTLVAVNESPSLATVYRVSDGRFLNSMGVQPERADDFIEPTVTSIEFSPDGTLLATGWDDNKVRLWRVSDGSLLHVFEGHDNTIKSLAFSPDGTILASGSFDKTVRLWRVSDGMPLRTLKGHTDWVNSLAFSPDGTLLASASYDGSVRVWRVSDGALLHELTELLGGKESVTFSPDGTLLASGTFNGAICLWSVSDGQLLRILKGHIARVEKVLFSPDGTVLASGSDDDTVRLWRLDELIVLPGWTTVLKDSFDNNVNDWPTSLGLEDEYWFSSTQQISRGVYRWEGKAKRDVLSWVWPDIKDLSDFHLSVEVRQTGGVNNAEAGVVFRLSDNDFYMFSIVPQQQKYGLWVSQDGEWKTLLDWTESSAIAPDGWNRIEVRGKGPLLTVWINGQQMASVSDSSLAKGKIGLIIGLYNSGDEAAFEFDNFEVREPSITPVYTPTSVPTLPPPTPTVTPVPPAKEPSVLIRLGPGKYGKPLWLEVVSGEYMLASGTTLLPGSSIGVFEEWLTFPPGLAIDVVDGAITLKGKTYPPGTKLIVNSQGNLVPR